MTRNRRSVYIPPPFSLSLGSVGLSLLPVEASCELCCFLEFIFGFGSVAEAVDERKRMACFLWNGGLAPADADPQRILPLQSFLGNLWRCVFLTLIAVGMEVVLRPWLGFWLVWVVVWPFGVLPCDAGSLIRVGGFAGDAGSLPARASLHDGRCAPEGRCLAVFQCFGSAWEVRAGLPPDSSAPVSPAAEWWAALRSGAVMRTLQILNENLKFCRVFYVKVCSWRITENGSTCNFILLQGPGCKPTRGVSLFLSI